MRLTGLSIEKFQDIYSLFEKKWEMEKKKDNPSKNRKRKLGGGRNYDLTIKGRLLLTLLYCRLNTSQEFLGFLFDLNQSNISRNISLVHPILSKIFKVPEKRVTMAEIELLELIFDATEQQIYRPQIG